MRYRIYPCGETAVTFDLDGPISPGSNEMILQMNAMILEKPISGLQEVILSYSSLTLLFDIKILQRSLLNGQSVFGYTENFLSGIFKSISRTEKPKGATHLIPVCYDPSLGIDLHLLASQKNMDLADLTELHHSKIYRIYMIGFLPGFPYMGTLDEKLLTERKEKPSKVPAGSVAIAGSQTGIYPFESPGGWNVIGQTPLQLFDPLRNPPVIFNAGDHVQFYPISPAEFREMKKSFSHEPPH
jgi:inhibitor of KinA